MYLLISVIQLPPLVIGAMAPFLDRVGVPTAAICALSSLASLGHAGAIAGAIADADNEQLSARDSAAVTYYVPPYYPAPYGGWVADWQDSYAKAKALVDSMTLAEKTNITAGTGIYMGKHGLFIRSGELESESLLY